jgi:hypothetical protein
MLVTVEDAVLADVPGLAMIAAQLIVWLETIADPERSMVHGDTWSPNMMINNALRLSFIRGRRQSDLQGDHCVAAPACIR